MRARVHQAQAREYVQRGRSDRRVRRVADVRAHLAERRATSCSCSCRMLTVAFIKAEVILSFLGFGVPVDVVSWGTMLNEAQSELILGKWWQLVAAGAGMAMLVTAFSPVHRRLRDALDPKLGLTRHRRRRAADRHAAAVGATTCASTSASAARSRASRPCGHQLRHPAEPHRRAGRRVGQRQDRDRAGDPRPAARTTPTVRRQRSASTAATSRSADAAAICATARQATSR